MTPSTAIERLAAAAERLGQSALADQARALARRRAEGRFFVACVGQFKRGKSTLIDALIGEPLLPVGALPVTSVPTVVRHGLARAARILRDGRWQAIAPEDLPAYVSEEGNPGNTKAVDGVEVFVPSPLLAGGLCLVDTPGVGSVFAANTEAARAFIPHVDVALVVLGADPPITAAELALIGDIARHVRHWIVVMNKADRTSPEDLEAAWQFAATMLAERLSLAVGPILSVSARERLDGRGPDRDWPGLLEALSSLARDHAGGLVEAAVARGAGIVAAGILTCLDLEREGLLRPLADSERRAQEIEATLQDAERALGDLGALLESEQRRLARDFADRRDAFLRSTLPTARAELGARVADIGSRGRRLRRQLNERAQDLAAELVGPWLAGEQARAEDAYTKAVTRFIALARELVERAGDAAIALSPDLDGAAPRFQVPSGFRFHELNRIAYDASPLTWLADLLRGAVGARAGIKRQAAALLDELLITNSARVEGDLNERVLESRRRLERAVRAALEQARGSAAATLARIRAAHAAGAAVREAVLDQLEALRAEVRQAEQACRGGRADETRESPRRV